MGASRAGVAGIGRLSDRNRMTRVIAFRGVLEGENICKPTW
jgi:hypothetical protein